MSVGFFKLSFVCIINTLVLHMCNSTRLKTCLAFLISSKDHFTYVNLTSRHISYVRVHVSYVHISYVHE